METPSNFSMSPIPPVEKPEDVIYNVMPQVGPMKAPVPAPPSPNAPLAAAPVSNLPSTSDSGTRKSYPTSSANHTWIYIVAGVVVVLALAGGAYYMVGYKKTATPSESPTSESVTETTTAPKLSADFLQKYFNTTSCTDTVNCGYEADPDSDGLSNYQEQAKNTNPINPDADNDGIADGDEVNIYHTDPTLPVSDTRPIAMEKNYTDGVQIKNGYDPLTGAKFTDERKLQVDNNIAKFKLHAPSTTTLQLATDGQQPLPPNSVK